MEISKTFWQAQWWLVVIAFALGLPIQLSAQLAEELLSRATPMTIPAYEPDPNYENIILGSGYGSEAIRKLPVTSQRIVKIDLVYTAYSEDPAFDQRELDLRRMEQLLTVNPQLASNQLFEWRYIKQTGCGSTQDCLDFFHGFVVYYDRYYKKKDTRLEIDSINQELAELDFQILEYETLVKVEEREIPCEYPTLLTSIDHISDQLKEFYSCTEKFSGKVFFNAALDDKGRPQDIKIKGRRFPCPNELIAILRHILRWRTGMRLGDRKFPVTVHGSIEFPIKAESFSFYRFDPAEDLVERFQIQPSDEGCLAMERDTSYVDVFPFVKKTEVSTVLERNDWSDNLFVVDVTGSMFPYSADLLRWMKLLPSPEPQFFVFFNDGDDKPAASKRMGNAGGIGWVETRDFSEAKAKMFEVMRRGGGGDTPENNIEALLFGMTKSPGATSAVMVADNAAFPRDAQLVTRYDGDLKIILCGTTRGINTAYLNMAYLQGFSIHTTEADLTDLRGLQQGQVITVGGYNYRLTQQGFKKEFIR